MSENKPPINWRQLLFYASIFIIAPILTFIIGRWMDEILHLPKWPGYPSNLLGIGIIACGVVIGIKSTRQLYFKGSGLPWGEAKKEVQTTHLVTSGLYAHTRHPMTMGYSLLPCGMGLIFQSPGMTFGITILILLINISIIKVYEEPHLEERFGLEYLTYKEKTPFLIPRIRALKQQSQKPIKKENNNHLDSS